ncbi:HAMP domain-containing sensor histidine kinase [Bacillus thuringiensis]|uniref:sensor histidine kinase n=1 Tax=Bacillus thuringiensis TaxID=1428 RepID=UPI000A383E0F|nr:HAMP domain-containing sensor histidine kinase [Bacillus thuringiensis]MEB8650022.1 HAMP domain-containing sensor histidine kinase [Bacillus cereus]MEB8669219.1 HAMP domain-containing sensor histidine kinase [Bacillus cereus]MED3352788.1 HAMP domain-containing sensor histidine kinase [Bacillus thuringiensis]MRB11552.1 HAMP domain-containing protein [Bacillus thuringiensis]OTW77403.1 two-component sensor histidine kinase [Bacillus thuringiensis serovar sumiyoshiensis]
MKNKVLYILIKNYVIFALAIGFTVIILFIFLMYQTEKQLGKLNNLKASEVVRENFKTINAESIESFGGWVEILNENLQVIYTKGEKKDKLLSYSQREFTKLLFDNDKLPYYSSVATFVTKKGETLYCLVKVPKKAIKYEYTFSDKNEEYVYVFYKILLTTIVLFFVFFSMNVYIFSRQIARKITRPLDKLATGFEEIASGKYDKRLNYETYFELMQIQHSFNVMSEKLDKIEKEKKRLEETKQKMLVDLSHDLRTPITTVQGYIEALQLGIITEKSERERTLNVIYNKIRIIAVLTEDIFELSKLEHSDYPFEVHPTDVSEFIRELLVEYYDLFQAKRLILQYQIPSKEVIAPINNRLLYRAISNIISNALQYNTAGTTVFVSLIEDESKVYINIIDNGIGIPEDMKQSIFDAFVRVDDSRENNGGSGLGLTIAKYIVEKHGGKISLESAKKRTIFCISLPKLNG